MTRARSGSPTLRVERVRPSGTNLTCSLAFDGALEPFLNSGLLYFDYDFPLEGVPPSILSVPVLGILAPMAWATGSTVVAGDVDSEYVSSMQEVAKAMQGMYPKLRLASKVECTRVSTPWEADPERTCLLYSGGVDSTASLIRNLDSKLMLATVRGAPDLRLWEGEFWERVEGRVAPFVKGLGVERHVIETNALDVLNFGALGDSLKDALPWGWWENLAHGLALLSFCAPLTYFRKVGKMMIASSFSVDEHIAWGSTPESDRNVRWGGVTTVHDSFDLLKVRKVREVLVPFVEEHPGPVPLRVCTGKREARLESGELNCGRCEKCVRTALILLSAGIDPAMCGFPAPDLGMLKEGLVSGRFRNPSGTSLRAVQAAKTPPRPELVRRYPGLDLFFDWLYRWEPPPLEKKRRRLARLAPRGTRRRMTYEALFGPVKKGD